MANQSFLMHSLAFAFHPPDAATWIDIAVAVLGFAVIFIMMYLPKKNDRGVYYFTYPSGKTVTFDLNDSSEENRKFISERVEEILTTWVCVNGKAVARRDGKPLRAYSGVHKD